MAEASNYEATSASFEVNRFLKTSDDRADHVSQVEFGRTSLDQPLLGAIVANPLVADRPSDGLVTWNFFEEMLKGGIEFPVFSLDKAIELPTTPCCGSVLVERAAGRAL